MFTFARSTSSVKKKITRFASFDDQVSYAPEGRKMCSDDEEELAPGTYLLPVRDPLFTVRVREYRRSRFEKLRSQVSCERSSPGKNKRLIKRNFSNLFSYI